MSRMHVCCMCKCAYARLPACLLPASCLPTDFACWHARCVHFVSEYVVNQHVEVCASVCVCACGGACATSVLSECLCVRISACPCASMYVGTQACVHLTHAGMHVCMRECMCASGFLRVSVRYASSRTHTYLRSCVCVCVFSQDRLYVLILDFPTRMCMCTRVRTYVCNYFRVVGARLCRSARQFAALSHQIAALQRDEAGCDKMTSIPGRTTCNVKTSAGYVPRRKPQAGRPLEKNKTRASPLKSNARTCTHTNTLTNTHVWFTQNSHLVPLRRATTGLGPRPHVVQGAFHLFARLRTTKTAFAGPLEQGL